MSGVCDLVCEDWSAAADALEMFMPRHSGSLEDCDIDLGLRHGVAVLRGMLTLKEA